MKTKLLVFLQVILMLICKAIPASAEENSVTLRIEGITENLYYGEVAIDSDPTVAEVVISADTASDDITVIGAENGFITDVNGDTAGKFGGWDGWLFSVNGVSPTVGISDYVPNAGDVIVIYYSDAYGVGMQYPVMDATDIANGVIAFTSTDVTYDESFNAITSVNPVADMTVLFDETEFKTDENGIVTIPAELLTSGEHTVAVSKVNQNGIPLVLRLAPDTKVVIPEPTTDEADESSFNPAYLIPVFAAVVIAVLGVVIAIKKKNK